MLNMLMENIESILSNCQEVRYMVGCCQCHRTPHPPPTHTYTRETRRKCGKTGGALRSGNRPDRSTVRPMLWKGRNWCLPAVKVFPSKGKKRA